MSYSFSVKASTKDEAKLKIADKMAEVALAQPDHALDQAAVVAAGSAFVDMLGDVPPEQEIHVSIHGSVSWKHAGTDELHVYTGASVSISVGHVKQAVQP